MSHFFSIIIPVYNVAPYLRECLDSVLAQTFENWEAICVDDGSTDGSNEILDEYAIRDARIRVVHQKNAGVSAARNFALSLIDDNHRVGYVAFMDGDDWVDDKWLEQIANEITAIDGDVDLIRTRQYTEIAENLASIIRQVQCGGGDKCLQSSKSIQCSLLYSVLRDGYIWLNCYKASVIRGLRFPKGLRIMEDCVFNAYAVMRAKNAILTNTNYYMYRMRKGSAVHTKSNKSLVVEISELFLHMKHFYQVNVSRVQADLWHIRSAITDFVLYNIVHIAICQRLSEKDYEKNIHGLMRITKEMYDIKALNIRSLRLLDMVSLWLFIRINSCVGFILIWKLKALRYYCVSLTTKVHRAFCLRDKPNC